MAADPIYDLLENEGKTLILALDKALPREKDASGALRSTMRFTIERGNTGWSFDLYLKDYYKWIDEGVKPGHHPPLQVLLNWLKVKQFSLRDGKFVHRTKGSKLQKISDDLKLANRIAWGISYKIFYKGIAPTYFYSNTIPPWVARLKQEVALAFKDRIKVEVIHDIKNKLQKP